jgi:hypothetical protein
MILWILQPFFVFSPSTFRQTPVQAHVAGFWMKINPALVEGKWGEGVSLLLQIDFADFIPPRLREAGQDFVVPRNCLV